MLMDVDAHAHRLYTLSIELLENIDLRAGHDQVVLGRPTPPEALLAEEMPLEAHFRRDHFPAPDLDPATWELSVGGAVQWPLRLAPAERQALGRRREVATRGGGGHRGIEPPPPVPGLAWALGAVGEAHWTGAPLRALL